MYRILPDKYKDLPGIPSTWNAFRQRIIDQFQKNSVVFFSRESLSDMYKEIWISFVDQNVDVFIREGLSEGWVEEIEFLSRVNMLMEGEYDRLS